MSPPLSIKNAAVREQFRESCCRHAIADLGYVEETGNRTRFGKWFGLDGKPWCAQAVSKWLHAAATEVGCENPLAGLETRKGFAGTQFGFLKAKARGMVIGTDEPVLPGDVPIWQTTLTTGHTGLVVRVFQNGSFETIEGNSSRTDLSSRNGGEVVLHAHTRTDGKHTKLRGIIRPSRRYHTPPNSTTPMENTTRQMVITADQLIQAMPGLELDRADQLLDGFNMAAQLAEINTPRRMAHWCAQLGHESSSLRYMEEIATGQAYEGREDLGNVRPGDGRRFKGHGPIQVTGRANHAAATKWMRTERWIDSSIDFEKTPELLASPEYGFLGAAWFWSTRRLNALADHDKIDTVTRVINGGLNGLSDRKARLELCKRIFE